MRPWILLTVIFSFQWLAGEPLTMLATFGLCVAYAFYRCGVKGKLWSEPNFRLLAIFFLVGAGMMLLCAAQFLPASDLLSQSRRGVQGLSFGETTNWSVNPFSLPEMIVPDFFGSGIAAPTGWLWLMSDSNLGPHYLSVFVGFVPLFFALAGWALGTRPPPQLRGRRGRSFPCCSPSATLRRSLLWLICFSRPLPWCATPSSSWSWLPSLWRFWRAGDLTLCAYRLLRGRLMAAGF